MNDRFRFKHIVTAVFSPNNWIDWLIGLIAMGLLLRGRLIGIGFASVVWSLKWIVLPRLSVARRLKVQLRVSSPYPLGIVIGIVPVLLGAAFVGLNQLPVIGDLSLQNYRALGLIWVCFGGYGYLISHELERPQRTLIPLIVVAVYALLSLGLMIDKEYLIVATLLTLGCVSVWHWWLDHSGPFSRFRQLSTVTTAPSVVFVLGQIVIQDRLAALFSSGLLLQHFYVIPGLFLGFLSGVFIGKFQMSRPGLAIFPVTPIAVAIVLGGEAALAFWLAFSFSSFVSGLMNPERRDTTVVLSLLVTIVMFLTIAQLQSISLVLDTNFRSLLAVLTIGFWMVAALFGNAIRKEPLLESHRPVIKKRLQRRG